MAVKIGARGIDGCGKEGDARPTDPFGNAGLVDVGSPGELVDDLGSGTCAALGNMPPKGLCRGDFDLVGPNVIGGVAVRGDRSNLDLSTCSEAVGRKSVGCSTACAKNLRTGADNASASKIVEEVTPVPVVGPWRTGATSVVRGLLGATTSDSSLP